MLFAIRQILTNSLLFLCTSLVSLISAVAMASASANNSDLISSQYLEVYQQENKAEVENYLRLTPLIKATKDRNAKAVQVFIDSGVNPNAQMLGGATALHIAAANNDTETVKVLLLNNVDVNRRDNELWTPLMRAAINGNLEVIRMLLVIKQIDLTAANRFGDTAVLHAAMANCSICETEILKAINNRRQQSAFNDLGNQLEKSIQIAKKRKNNDLINILEAYYAQDYRNENYNFSSEDNELIDVRDVESVGKRLEAVASTTEEEQSIDKTQSQTANVTVEDQNDYNKNYTTYHNVDTSKPLQVLQVNSNYGIAYRFMGKQVKEYEMLANKNESSINNLLVNETKTAQPVKNNYVLNRYNERNNQSATRQKFIFNGKSTIATPKNQSSQDSHPIFVLKDNNNNNNTQSYAQSQKVSKASKPTFILQSKVQNNNTENNNGQNEQLHTTKPTFIIKSKNTSSINQNDDKPNNQSQNQPINMVQPTFKLNKQTNSNNDSTTTKNNNVSFQLQKSNDQSQNQPTNTVQPIFKLNKQANSNSNTTATKNNNVSFQLQKSNVQPLKSNKSIAPKFKFQGNILHK